MKTLQWMIVAGLAFLYCQLSAQAKLGITIDSFPTLLTTQDSGMQQQLTMHVHNYGDSLFNDSVALKYLVNGQLYSADTANLGIYFPPGSLSINPFDSVAETLTLTFNITALEIIGSSAVVIWPISNGAPTYDSLFYNVQIVLAAIPPVSSENLKVYIYQQQLFINSNAPNLLSRVRIYDVQGQMLLQQSLASSTSIPLDRFSSGCYLVEVTLSDNTKQVYKLINMAGR